MKQVPNFILLLFFFLCSFPCRGFCQEQYADDTFYNKSDTLSDTIPAADIFQATISSETDEKQSIKLARFILPSILITYGIIAQNNKELKEIDNDISNEAKRHIQRKLRYDDYLLFVPVASAYGLNFLGIKGKHNLRDLTTIMITSHLISVGSTQLIKGVTNRWRPNGLNQNSFPSGHTAVAFTGAHILFKEYYETSPWIAIGGYTVAATTGVFRVLNQHHWTSDVIAGAGFGILSVELSYILLPVINNILFPSQKQKSVSFVPIIGQQNIGFSMAYIY